MPMVNPLYTTPGNYYGMYDDGVANFHSQERGGIDQYDFNVASISTTGSILD